MDGIGSATGRTKEQLIKNWLQTKRVFLPSIREANRGWSVLMDDVLAVEKGQGIDLIAVYTHSGQRRVIGLVVGERPEPRSFPILWFAAAGGDGEWVT